MLALAGLSRWSGYIYLDPDAADLLLAVVRSGRCFFADTRFGPLAEGPPRPASAEWLVDDEVMSLGDDAHLMHPMPIRRNLEVTDAVLDGPRSLVLRQAANRLPTQKGLLSLMSWRR